MSNACIWNERVGRVREYTRVYILRMTPLFSFWDSVVCTEAQRPRSSFLPIAAFSRISPSLRFPHSQTKSAY